MSAVTGDTAGDRHVARDIAMRRENNRMKVVRSLGFALLIGVGLAVVVFVILRWVPFGEYPGGAFFDLAAQTIPILLVALAVEAQARRFDLEEAGKRIRIAAVVFLAGGETAAVAVAASLYVPDQGTLASDLLIVVTAIGLLGGFFAVIAIALKTSTPPSAIEYPTPSVEGRGPAPEPSQFERRREPVGLLGPTIPILTSAFVSMLVWRLGLRNDRD